MGDRGDSGRLPTLAAHLEALEFGLSGDRSEAMRREATRVARLLRGIVARTAQPDAPLLVVVAGGTGAGKSTTVNTLVGKRVVAASVVRPTTRAPTLVCHPREADWFRDDRVLPHLSRVTGDHDDARSAGQRLIVALSESLPAGVAVLDTPDIDSVEWGNHRLAEDAMDAADAWVWLATSRTYADEVGMRYLRRARSRQAIVAMVVTQIRPHERDEVLDDVDRLLAAQGCEPDLRLSIPFVDGVDDLLPENAVRDLRDWLVELAPMGVRHEVRQRALEGARAAAPGEIRPVAEAVEDELATADRLRGAVEAAYEPLVHRLDEELDEGVPLRAEVLNRWRSSLGADPFAPVQSAINRVRGLITDAIRGRGAGPDDRRVKVEVEGGVGSVVVRLLEQSSWDARRAWEQDTIGRMVLERRPELRDGDPEREDRVREAVVAWTDHIGELIADVAPERRTRARWASTGLNAVATSALLVVFATSGGLTGAEVGITAAAGAAGQSVLVWLFGEHNVRKLLDDIRTDLHDRVERLVAADQRPFLAALDEAAPAAETAAALREVVDGKWWTRGS